MCLPFDPEFHDPIPHPEICLEMRMIYTNILLYRGVHHSYICEKFVKTLSSNKKRLQQKETRSVLCRPILKSETKEKLSDTDPVFMYNVDSLFAMDFWINFDFLKNTAFKVIYFDNLLFWCSLKFWALGVCLSHLTLAPAQDMLNQYSFMVKGL